MPQCMAHSSTKRARGAILGPIDHEGESELDEPKPKVPGKAVCIVGLKVADPAIVVLELALQDEVRLGGRS